MAKIFDFGDETVGAESWIFPNLKVDWTLRLCPEDGLEIGLTPQF